MINLEELADQVLAIDNSNSREDVLLDLEYTKSVEETINRIFDNQFLQGAQRKSTASTTKAKPTFKSHNNNNNALIILDSDEDEEEEEQKQASELSLHELPNDIVLSPKSLRRRAINFNDNDGDDDDEDNDDHALFPTKKYIDSIDDLARRNTYTLQDSPRRKLSYSLSIFEDDDDLPPLSPKIPTERSITLDSIEETTAPQKKRDMFEGFFPSMDSMEHSDDDELPPVSPKKSIERSITLDSLEETAEASNASTEKRDMFEGILPPLDSFYQQSDDEKEYEYKHKSTITTKRRSLSLSPLRNYADDDDPFSLDLSEPKKQPKKKSPSNDDSNSISLVDDSDDDSLPSMGDFLDRIINEKSKPKRKVYDLDDGEPVIDRKGKRRAYEYNISPPPPPPPPRSATASTSLLDDDDETTTTTSSSMTAKERKKLEAEERKRVQAEERKRAAEEKKRQKEIQAAEKQRLKEQKQSEKERAQLLEKENRLKANRTEILKEMIVEMHPDFVKTKAGELITLILEKKEAVTKIMPTTNKSYHITWKRICSSEWDPTTMTFIPFSPSKIVKEPYVLVYVDIFDFVVRVQQDTMDDFIDDIKRQGGQDIQIMLLLEGLDVYYKKKLLATRRAVDNQVRSNIEGEAPTTAARQRKTNAQAEIIKNGPDREQVEECINYLQLMRDIMFVPTKNDEDTAGWLESLTTDLALGRYKTKNANNSFKASKSGTDPKDSYHKMLQEIQLCTPAIADSVIGEYPTLQSLHKAYERKSVSAGELLLADLDVERSAMRARDRKINRVMSKKIYTIFNSNDPDQTIY